MCWSLRTWDALQERRKIRQAQEGCDARAKQVEPQRAVLGVLKGKSRGQQSSGKLARWHSQVMSAIIRAFSYIRCMTTQFDQHTARLHLKYHKLSFSRIETLKQIRLVLSCPLMLCAVWCRSCKTSSLEWYPWSTKQRLSQEQWQGKFSNRWELKEITFFCLCWSQF